MAGGRAVVEEGVDLLPGAWALDLKGSVARKLLSPASGSSWCGLHEGGLQRWLALGLSVWSCWPPLASYPQQTMASLGFDEGAGRTWLTSSPKGVYSTRIFLPKAPCSLPVLRKLDSTSALPWGTILNRSPRKSKRTLVYRNQHQGATRHLSHCPT